MNRTKLLALLASTAIGFSALAYVATAQDETQDEKAADETKTEATTTDDYVVLRYNGGEIRKSELDRLWSNMFPSPDAPEFDSFDDNVKVEILKNVARERLILDKAYAKNLDKSDEVKKQLENLKRQVMIQAYFKTIMDELVPEKELKKQYEVIAEKYAGKQEVKASHILVETEEEAKEVVEQLDEGTDFAELAKEKSADTGSGAQGGDLGWFTKERMVPEFAEAAFKLGKGEVSDPVKSDFGWHIIKMEDKRIVQPPPFEEVKPELQKTMANQAIEGYVRGVIEDANLKFYGPGGDELEPTAAEAEDAE